MLKTVKNKISSSGLSQVWLRLCSRHSDGTIFWTFFRVINFLAIWASCYHGKQKHQQWCDEALCGSFPPAAVQVLSPVTHSVCESVDGLAQRRGRERDSIWGSPLFDMSHFQREWDGVPPWTAAAVVHVCVDGSLINMGVALNGIPGVWGVDKTVNITEYELTSLSLLKSYEMQH